MAIKKYKFKYQGCNKKQIEKNIGYTITLDNLIINGSNPEETLSKIIHVEENALEDLKQVMSELNFEFIGEIL